jgi:tctex1 domain-containing protein 2
MTESKGNPSRRLSFMDPPPPVAAGTTAPTNAAQASDPRRQSTWNQQQQSRKSIFPGGGGSMMLNRRQSHSLSHSSRKSSHDIFPAKVKLQNTYRTEPNEDERFQAYKIEPKLFDLLKEALKGKKYSSIQSGTYSKELSQDIMRETRLLMNNASPRYKLVAHVAIGEPNGQDVRVGSRCVWDSAFDNCASVVYKNENLFAVATVFAIYFE